MYTYIYKCIYVDMYDTAMVPRVWVYEMMQDSYHSTSIPQGSPGFTKVPLVPDTLP